MLGHLLKQKGDLAAALLEFAEALRLDPLLTSPRSELIHFGARDSIPDEALDPSVAALSVIDLSRSLSNVRRSIDEHLTMSTYPLRAYNEFRHAFPIQPPPRDDKTAWPTFTIVIDAVGQAPAFVRETLVSLIDQRFVQWQAIVLADVSLSEHSVASYVAIEPRIRFITELKDIAQDDRQWTISLSAERARSGGSCLVRICGKPNRAVAVFADQDQRLDHWCDTPRYAKPSFFGVFDRDVMLQTTLPPCALALRSEYDVIFIRLLSEHSGPEARRRVLLAMDQSACVAHLPRILASRLMLPERARGAPQDAKNEIPLLAIGDTRPAIGDSAMIGGVSNHILPCAGERTLRLAKRQRTRKSSSLCQRRPSRDAGDRCREFGGVSGQTCSPSFHHHRQSQ